MPRARAPLLLLLLAVLCLARTTPGHADPAPMGALAELHVKTPSTWGEVLVNGVLVGLAPVRVPLTSGKHVVELRPTEYHRGVIREVELHPGQLLELPLWPEWRPSWLQASGFPAGTVLRIDDGPGPELRDGTRVAIEDQAMHHFEFRYKQRALQQIAVKRCLEANCLLPGQTRLVRWQAPVEDEGKEPKQTSP
jgi:hypothetical protein